MAVFGLVALFLLRYRNEIAELLERLREVKTPMGAVSVFPQSELSDEILKELTKLPEALQEQREQLEQTAKSRDEWEKLAVQYAVAYYYEQTYRLIYGSQLDALRYLNLKLDGATANELDIFYQRHLTLTRAVSPGYDASRGEFLGFLVRAELVETRSEDNRYLITQWGQGLLSSMTLARMLQFKAY